MPDVLTISNEADMLDFGRKLAAVLRPGDVIALNGGLGAGKTTLARGMLAALGLEEEAPSPTFAIVQPYELPLVRLPVVHVDLYRLEDPEDVRELGLDDYLIDGVVLMEWPERMGAALWSHSLSIDIAIEEHGARRLTVQVPEAWKDRWPPLP